MFNRASIKLMLQYSLLIVGLFWVVSLGVYLYMDRQFGGDYLQIITRNKSHTQPGGSDQQVASINEAADASLDHLRTGLILLNGGLLLLIPPASFFLACSTLKPIKISYEAQQDFADNASHELRTPLAVLTGELELALTKPRSASEYHQTLLTSAREAQVLTRLVGELLSLARNDEATIQHNFEHVELSCILHAVVARHKSAASATALTFEIQSTSVWLVGNELLLSQVIDNLVDNAVKFSPAGGVVTIKLFNTRGRIYLEVADRGAGMTRGEYRQALTRFWRSEAARTVQGHGLGLAVAHKIIKLHRGTITLKPREGGGTRAILTLPAASTTP